MPVENSRRTPLLQLRGISKRFGAQPALSSVDFELRPGEVHVLAGENGAGKSTLIKILGGVHQPDDGQIVIDGRAVRFAHPRQASAAGIAVIFQELSLVPELSVADNMHLGHEQCRWGFVDRAAQRHRAAGALAELGVKLDVRRPAGEFPIATRQMIEIAKALLRDARRIVMDEPTSALREPEARLLFERIAALKQRGMGIIYITHKLEEVYQIADRITVLRDGQWIVTGSVEHIPAPALVHHMIGRSESPAARLPVGPEHAEPAGDFTIESAAAPRLKLSRLTLRGGVRGRPVFDGVSLSVSAGEIVGLAGLEGSGNSAVLHAVFGNAAGRLSGEIRIDGVNYRPASPERAIARGIALVTNDRQRDGLVGPLSVAGNLALAALPSVSPYGIMRAARLRGLTTQCIRELDLRAASPALPVAALSGGNQQKVVLGKWLARRPRVMLLDDPTRGVDVGAKREIHDLLRRLTRGGMAILLISSELPELLSLSDRIVVLHRGRVAGDFRRHEATAERVLRAAMGG